MTDRAAILRKVRGLLALSKSPNPHEAEAAAAAAQRLMQRHRLEQAEVEATPEPLEAEAFAYAGRTIVWKRDLAFAVARGFFCRAVHSPPEGNSARRAWISLVGRREDVAVAREVFAWLAKELPRQAALWVKATIGGTRGPKRYAVGTYVWSDGATRSAVTAQHDFLKGAVHALAARLVQGTATFAAATPEARDLVRRSDAGLDAFLAKAFARLEPSPAGRAIVDPRAFMAGERVGAQVALRPAKEIDQGGAS